MPNNFDRNSIVIDLIDNMRTKPITPFMHGIIDYGFVVSLLLIPSLIGLNKKQNKCMQKMQ